MVNLKPINITPIQSSPNQRLTAAESGKLWATYMGNSMSIQIIRYYLQHVSDPDIKTLLENALNLSKEFIKTIKDIFTKENIPIPSGFSEKDVNLGAPRLFEDEFYIHYLKYAAKAGMSIYNVAIPLMYREDIKNFFIESLNSTIKLIEQINELLMGKGFIMKVPQIPLPDKVEFVKENYLNGFIGNIRPLHALEITHLYDNIENNVTSKALIMGFAQVVKNENIRELFIRGKDMTHKAVNQYKKKLNEEDLPSPTFLDHLVTNSTFAPFSDKLMLFHKVDMFSMKIRSFGNSMAVNGRHDIALMYSKSLANIALFVSEGAKIMIDNGWMEQPPEAVDRNKIIKKAPQ